MTDDPRRSEHCHACGKLYAKIRRVLDEEPLKLGSQFVRVCVNLGGCSRAIDLSRVPTWKRVADQKEEKVDTEKLNAQ
jgi:hypothetical protein